MSHQNKTIFSTPFHISFRQIRNSLHGYGHRNWYQKFHSLSNNRLCYFFISDYQSERIQCAVSEYIYNEEAQTKEKKEPSQQKKIILSMSFADTKYTCVFKYVRYFSIAYKTIHFHWSHGESREVYNMRYMLRIVLYRKRTNK